MENQSQKQQDFLEKMLDRATKKDVVVMIQTAVGQLETRLGICEEEAVPPKKEKRKLSEGKNLPGIASENYEQQEDAGREMRQILFEQDISVPIAHVNRLLINITDVLDGKTIVDGLKGRIQNFKSRLREATRNLPKNDPNLAILNELNMVVDVINELTEDQLTGTAKKWAKQVIRSINNLLAQQKSENKELSEELLQSQLNEFRKELIKALGKKEASEDDENWFLDSENYEG